MNKIENIMISIFSIGIMVAISGGALVFLLFLMGFILGGESAAYLSNLASKILMPYFIKSAAIGVFAGLITFYIHGKHELSIK